VGHPFLSIIIPAYNEESRLPSTLTAVRAFLVDQPYSYEVIIVDNRSTDRTNQIIQEFCDHNPFMLGLFEEKPGKGAAVQKGMLHARGEYRFMADADLSMPISEVNKFIPPQLKDMDVAIASREAKGAVRYNEPFIRHAGGRVMNWLIQFRAIPGLNDTQCGFKCFSAAVAEDLFMKQTLPGWAFDIELLFIARLRGYKIQEIPIQWTFSQESKVNAFQDAIKILQDIRTIHSNHKQGLYDPEN
jgi:glycosyltransferase involved in cell wall biosynthesis